MFWAKCTKTALKLRKSVILRNLHRRELYQQEKTTHLVALYDNNEIWTKKMESFVLGKVLFYETYIEGSNINQKLLIWSLYKIIMKFAQKKL